MESINVAGAEIYIDKSERYIQVNDIGIGDVEALWEQLKAGFNGYDVMFCYHNTDVPVNFMKKAGAILVDDCIEMRANRVKQITPIGYDITPITELNFEMFASYHDKRNPDMFWTSKRIKEDLSKWHIVICNENDCIAGYMLLAVWDAKQAEVFCIDARDNARCEALLSAAVSYAVDAGKNEVLFMADKDSIEASAATALGFKITGKYIGYKAKVIACVD